MIVNPTQNTVLNQVICQEQSYNVGASIYHTTGTYTDTLRTWQGCDSTITLNLIVNPTPNTILNQVICQGQSYSVGTSVYNATGTYTDILQTWKGCDSTVTLNLVVNPLQSIILNEIICEGQSFIVGTSVYNTTGTYTDILSTWQGCDSTVTLNLVVNPTPNTILNQAICQGESYSVGTSTYDSTGIYTDVLSTWKGCDSTITLHLVVNPLRDTIINEAICQGQFYSVGASVYTMTGTYTDTLQTWNGCDSIVTLHLIINSLQDTILNEVLCQGEIYYVGTSVYSTTGVYTDILQTWQGCDSTVTLNLIVNPSNTTFIYDTICTQTTYNFDGTVIYTSGIYQKIYSNIYGCDSTVILDLLVTSPIEIVGTELIDVDNKTLGSIDITVSGGITSYFYLWSNGATTEDINNLPIDFYDVTVTDAIGCQKNYEFEIGNLKIFDVFDLYPNPTVGRLSVNIEFKTPLDLVYLEIVDIKGQIIEHVKLGNQVTSIRETLDLSTLSNANYFIVLRSSNTVVAIKPVILMR